MKKLLSLVMIIALMMSMFMSCNNESNGTDELDIAYYAYNSEPILNWDPSVMFSNGVIVLNNVYETLLRFDPETKTFDPILATDYSSSDDGLTWNFKLREGVKFHDGTEFTAEDVKFSIERTMAIGQGASYIWFAIESIEVISDYEVQFNLMYPSAMDIAAACPYAAFIMPSEIANEADTYFEGGKAVGTGPYKLENSTMGDEVILTQNNEYWRSWNENQFDKVIFKKTSETSSRRQMIEKGEADIISELPAEDIEALKLNKDVIVESVPSFTNLIGMFNTEKSTLLDANIRQALSYAFPYNDVVDHAAGGYAKQSIGVVPDGMWGHSDTIKQYNYDLDKAKNMLEEAGIEAGELSLLLTYLSGDEIEKKTAELYKAELAKIGVELEIRGMNWESQWEMSMATNPEDRQDIFFMYWWPDIASPVSWMYSLFHSEEEILFNLSYYSDERVDTLIDEASGLGGDSINIAETKFVEAQDIIVEDAASLFIIDKTTQWVMNPSFKGFVDNPAYPKVVFFYDCYREK